MYHYLQACWNFRPSFLSGDSAFKLLMEVCIGQAEPFADLMLAKMVDVTDKLASENFFHNSVQSSQFLRNYAGEINVNEGTQWYKWIATVEKRLSSLYGKNIVVAITNPHLDNPSQHWGIKFKERENCKEDYQQHICFLGNKSSKGVEGPLFEEIQDEEFKMIELNIKQTYLKYNGIIDPKVQEDRYGARIGVENETPFVIAEKLGQESTKPLNTCRQNIRDTDVALLEEILDSAKTQKIIYWDERVMCNCCALEFSVRLKQTMSSFKWGRFMVNDSYIYPIIGRKQARRSIKDISPDFLSVARCINDNQDSRNIYGVRLKYNSATKAYERDEDINFQCIPSDIEFEIRDSILAGI
eukprot:Awhi_evm1s5928